MLREEKSGKPYWLIFNKVLQEALVQPDSLLEGDNDNGLKYQLVLALPDGQTYWQMGTLGPSRAVMGHLEMQTCSFFLCV